MSEFTARELMEKIVELAYHNEKLHDTWDELGSLEASPAYPLEQIKILRLRGHFIGQLVEDKCFKLSALCSKPSNAANMNMRLTGQVLNCLAFGERGGYLNLEAYQELAWRAAVEREQQEIDDALAAIQSQPSPIKKSRRI